MRNSERQHERGVIKDQDRPAMPEFYMPAMWPVDLQEAVISWFAAWRKRRTYLSLLRLSDKQLSRRDLSRPWLIEKVRMPLRQMVAEQRCRHRS